MLDLKGNREGGLIEKGRYCDVTGISTRSQWTQQKPDMAKWALALDEITIEAKDFVKFLTESVEEPWAENVPATADQLAPPKFNNC